MDLIKALKENDKPFGLMSKEMEHKPLRPTHVVFRRSK